MVEIWLVTIGWWQLVGGNWLVTIGWWQVVGGSWLVASGGDPRTSGPTSDPWRAPSAAPAMPITLTQQRRNIEHQGVRQGVGERPAPRLPRKSHTHSVPGAQITPTQRPTTTRAYIRPVGEHQMMRLPRKSHPRSSGDPGAPGRTSDPWRTPRQLVGDNWLVALGWGQLVGASLLVAVGWCKFVGGNWLVAVCGWKLVGGCCLVAIGWRQLVGGNWSMTIC